jgi:hypothetical protein
MLKQIRKIRNGHKYWSVKKDFLSTVLLNGMMGKSPNKVTGEKQQDIKALIFADNVLISGKVKRKLKKRN